MQTRYCPKSFEKLRMGECELENRHALTVVMGSNPIPSAFSWKGFFRVPAQPARRFAVLASAIGTILAPDESAEAFFSPFRGIPNARSKILAAVRSASRIVCAYRLRVAGVRSIGE